jgi:hypothetical protein
MIHLTTSEPLVVASIEGMGVAEPPKPLTRPSLGRVMFFGLLSKIPWGFLMFLLDCRLPPDSSRHGRYRTPQKKMK